MIAMTGVKPRMDEKTPHMHLCFVPLTADKRLSAKEIIGNRKHLTWWQDEFWKYMTLKYPELERGESASETGQGYIPPRVFKEMTRLNKQRERLEALLSGVNPFNAKARAEEIGKLLDGYIPSVEKMRNQPKKYRSAFTETVTENKKLRQDNEALSQSLKEATSESVLKKMKDLSQQRDYEAAVDVLRRIPREVLDAYTKGGRQRQEEARIEQR